MIPSQYTSVCLLFQRYHKSFIIFNYFPFQVRFLDQQPFFLQQSALQINFPPHQPQFDTQSRHLEEEQLLQDNNALAQGYIDESGHLCIIEYPETVDEAVGAASSETAHKQFSRHSTREKTRSSQKRRKKRKAKQQQSQQSAKKELGKDFWDKGWDTIFVFFTKEFEKNILAIFT